MKRHPALEQLSRDHHHALVVAQRLKRADGATAAQAREAFLAYWDADGRAHFREEEEVLLPACAGHLDVEAPLVARVLTDHVTIRHLAGRLAAGDRALDLVHVLGLRLERHVRHEERELFPEIERVLPDAELETLVDQLSP